MVRLPRAGADMCGLREGYDDQPGGLCELLELQRLFDRYPLLTVSQPLLTAGTTRREDYVGPILGGCVCQIRHPSLPCIELELIIQEAAQLPRPAGMLELPQRLRLD